MKLKFLALWMVADLCINLSWFWESLCFHIMIYVLGCPKLSSVRKKLKPFSTHLFHVNFVKLKEADIQQCAPDHSCINWSTFTKWMYPWNHGLCMLSEASKAFLSLQRDKRKRFSFIEFHKNFTELFCLVFIFT